MDATNEALRIQVLAVLDEVIDRLGRQDADYSYSSFASPESGIAEIDGYRDQFRAGVLRPVMLPLLFAPTGPIQEVAISSGWGDRFAELEAQIDAAFDQIQAGPAAK